MNCAQSVSSDLLFFGGEGPMADDALLDASACCFNLSYSSLVIEILSSFSAVASVSIALAERFRRVISVVVETFNKQNVA